MSVTSGEVWGAGRTLDGSLEEAECEQDAYADIHIRPLRGRIPCATASPRLRLGLFTRCLFKADKEKTKRAVVSRLRFCNSPFCFLHEYHVQKTMIIMIKK